MASTRTAACALQLATGPLAGRRFVLEDTLEIGRGEGADIQLVDPRVSRSHALLTVEDGRIVLVDTLSANGTWMGPQRVSRAEVRVGDCFTIGGSMFEVADARPDVASPDVAARGGKGRPRRATMDLGDSADMATIVGEDDFEPLSPGSDRGDFMALLFDVASFRILRLQQARGELDADQRSRYQSLADRFLVDNGASSLVSLARFGVEIPAEVVFTNRRDLVHETRIVELGADGVKILVPSQLAPPKTLGWLSIFVRDGEQTRTIVFTVSVEWTGGTMMELSLCGAPDWG